jgi:tRNA nucleotidyltransferase (CCA-adding enzyme)
VTTSSSSTAIVGDSEVAAFASANIDMKREHVDAYRQRVSSLAGRVEAKISADPSYAVVRALQAGSLAKGTALRSTSDFDLALYLRRDKAPQEDRELLPWLVERLKETRPGLDDSQFQIEDHCVGIKYADGREVDVVPILDAGTGDGDGDLITKDTGARVSTNIPLQLEFIRKRKRHLPVRYRQGIRLLKWWAKQLKDNDPGFRFKSYLAELVCTHLFDTGAGDLGNYPSFLMAVFAYIQRSGLREPIVFADYYHRSSVPAAAHGVMTVIDPVNPRNNVVFDYTEGERTAIVNAAGAALDALTEAEYTPYPSAAVAEWQTILGRQFRG